jgi:hypothetical protein
MSENGVRTPFLDKLSGRDRGQTKPQGASPAQQDPLIQDPFSLTMAGEAHKPSSSTPSKFGTLPAELNSLASRQHEWRDPRSLREARLGATKMLGASEYSTAARRSTDASSVSAAAASDPAPSVLTATLNRMLNASSDAVNTAGYERTEIPPGQAASYDARTNVNWYGLSEGNASQAKNLANSTLDVVTSTGDVSELQLALNNAVSASNGPWNLAPLAERARYLIEHGPTAIDRGQARLLLERIDAFQNVSARSQQISGAMSTISPVQSNSYNAGTQNSSLPNSPGSTSTTYDATGWLVPVHAAGPDQPTHALTNDTGDVLAYVSPIAGLNLDRYRNQAVGINGLRGYLPQLQAAHIQAQRVSRVR